MIYEQTLFFFVEVYIERVWRVFFKQLSGGIILIIYKFVEMYNIITWLTFGDRDFYKFGKFHFIQTTHCIIIIFRIFYLKKK